MFEVSQVSVFISFRMILGDGGYGLQGVWVNGGLQMQFSHFGGKVIHWEYSKKKELMQLVFIMF